jgi:hypothetical protein
MFSGYMFHPRYNLKDHAGQTLMELKKQPAMWEGKYSLNRLQSLDPVDELRCIMAFLMMTLLERTRG